jgi:hypothetical protein
VAVFASLDGVAAFAPLHLLAVLLIGFKIKGRRSREREEVDAVVLVHLQAFSRCRLALVDAVAGRVLVCFASFANS